MNDHACVKMYVLPFGFRHLGFEPWAHELSQNMKVLDREKN